MTAGLRDRRRVALRHQIRTVALELFAEQGFEAVTMEAIAEAVGISTSTLFRHVESKDELLVGEVRRGAAEVVALLEQRPVTEPVTESLVRALLARTSQFVEDGERLERWRHAMRSAPAQLRRAPLLSDEERQQLIAAVGRRLGVDPSRDLLPGVLVGGVLGAAEHAYEWWLAQQGRRSLHTLTEEALQHLVRDFGAAAKRGR